MKHGCNCKIVRELINQNWNGHNSRYDQDTRGKHLHTCSPEYEPRGNHEEDRLQKRVETPI